MRMETEPDVAHQNGGCNLNRNPNLVNAFFDNIQLELMHDAAEDLWRKSIVIFGQIVVPLVFERNVPRRLQEIQSKFR